MLVELMDNELPENAHIETGGGGYDSWGEYLACWAEDYQPYIEGIRDCIIREGIVGETAKKICNDYYFKAEDGKCIAFTWAAWGDLMSAIVDNREGYMKYYF